jgi:hypothetical protein
MIAVLRNRIIGPYGFELAYGRSSLKCGAPSCPLPKAAFFEQGPPIAPAVFAAGDLPYLPSDSLVIR